MGTPALQYWKLYMFRKHCIASEHVQRNMVGMFCWCLIVKSLSPTLNQIWAHKHTHNCRLHWFGLYVLHYRAMLMDFFIWMMATLLATEIRCSSACAVLACKLVGLLAGNGPTSLHFLHILEISFLKKNKS